MFALGRGDTSSVAKPYLHAFTALDARLLRPYSLTFAIFSAVDPAVAPTQIFPSVAGTTQPVDLDADAVRTGQYVAAWMVPTNEVLGRHVIRWFAVLTEGGVELSWEREFDVLAVPPVPRDVGYALVSAVRREGVEAGTTDARIIEQLVVAKSLIRRWLCRSFEPEYRVAKVDSEGEASVLLREPLCAVDSITANDTLLDPTAYVVYARHLTSGVLEPDDRQDPHIDLYAGSRLPVRRALSFRGSQVIAIGGVWGFTDPDGSCVGSIPLPIQRAAVLIALRGLPKASSQSSFNALNGYRLTSLRTREQSISFGGFGGGGSNGQGVETPFTGDPTIDSLLLPYLAPVGVSVP